MTNAQRQDAGQVIARARAEGKSDERIMDAIFPGWRQDTRKLTPAQRQKLNRLHKLVDPDWQPRDQKAAQKYAARNAVFRNAVLEAMQLRPLKDDPRYKQRYRLACTRVLGELEALNKSSQETGFDVDLARDAAAVTNFLDRTESRRVVLGYRPLPKLDGHRPSGAEDIEAIMREPQSYGASSYNLVRLRPQVDLNRDYAEPLPGEGPAFEPTDTPVSLRSPANWVTPPPAATRDFTLARARIAAQLASELDAKYSAEGGPGDYERRYTADTAPSRHARHGPRSQPWHARPPRRASAEPRQPRERRPRAPYYTYLPRSKRHSARQLRDSHPRYRPSPSVPEPSYKARKQGNRP